MNDLSLMLYLADVVDSIGEGMTVLAVMACIFLFGCLTTYAVCRLASFNCDYESQRESAKGLADAVVSPLRRSVFASVVSLLIVGLLPSKETVYLIMASEMAEEVVISEEMQIIKDTVMDYLKNLNPK